EHQYALEGREWAGGLLEAFGHGASYPLNQQDQGGEWDQNNTGQQQKTAHTGDSWSQRKSEEETAVALGEQDTMSA
ncbi:MAG: hypothetical protein LM522_04135, partial [Candidatus Contendobacter sp.]|nr:hypothetical protein [Candidatus Contendobacter sp.]